MNYLREQLQAIYEERGKLTPKSVVDAARPKSHPLHSRFEWNDKVAGERYREVQARDLIQSVKITYKRGDTLQQTRGFVSVQREDGYAYVPTEEVVEDEVLTEIVRRAMEREWRQLKSRYGHFVEFVELVRKEVEAA